jgi:hypothetical protein
MIFAKIKVDALSQENDGVRIDARQSIYRDIADVLDVEISPNIDGENDIPYISVYSGGDFDEWYLDWSYSVAGDYNPTIRIKTAEEDDSDPLNIIPVQYVTASKEITIITAATDQLFSNDDDIIQSEPDVYRYLPEGKTSYLFMHREAQRRILGYLDEKKIWKQDGTRYEKSDLFDKEEFVHWSRFLVLQMIYQAKVVDVGDIFFQKGEQYKTLVAIAQNRGAIRLSSDGASPATSKLDNVVSILVKR